MDSKSFEGINKLYKLYDKLGYYDVYSGSVLIFLFLCIILLGVYLYTRVMTNIKPIQDNWPAERCKPSVIPFAGLINTPEGDTIINYTQTNFTYCMQDILKSITGYAVDPITFLTYSLGELFQNILNTFNKMRVYISNIRTFLARIAENIMSRIANLLVPLQELIVKVIDTMGKARGILFTGLMTSLGSYFALKALLGAILEFIIKVLIVLAAIVVALWIIPFTWPAAAAGTLVFLSISIPLLIIMSFMMIVLQIQPRLGVPNKPGKRRCFDANTIVKLANGSVTSIDKITVGDVLKNGAIVTAFFKLDAKGVKMYKIDNVIVSGEHLVYCKDKWVEVSKCPNAVPVTNYFEPCIYCLNTTNKTIELGINDIKFSDWDELSESERNELYRYMREHSQGSINTCDENLHTYFEGGFYPDVKVKVGSNGEKEIKDIKVGEILKNGNRVYGVVRILRPKKYLGLKDPMGKYSRWGRNIHICEPDKNNLDRVEERKSILSECSEKHGDPYLYHLLTEKEYFNIEDRCVFHYNANIDLFLSEYRGKLLSMKYV